MSTPARAARERRTAELNQTTAAAVAALGGRVLRVARVAQVEPNGAADGGRLVVLDWDSDPVAPALVPATANRDVVFNPGDVVLVVMVGRSPFVVCRADGGPSVGVEE